jgi:DNA-directed RNA polymerase specialized sigma24 family protein
MPSEAADVLAALYPSLLSFADKQLRSRHLDHQLAEDLVQEAAASWFAAGTKLNTSARINTYLRAAIANRAENLRLRRSDALDRNPLSLDAEVKRGS